MKIIDNHKPCLRAAAFLSWSPDKKIHNFNLWMSKFNLITVEIICLVTVWFYNLICNTVSYLFVENYWFLVSVILFNRMSILLQMHIQVVPYRTSILILRPVMLGLTSRYIASDVRLLRKHFYSFYGDSFATFKKWSQHITVPSQQKE